MQLKRKAFKLLLPVPLPTFCHYRYATRRPRLGEGKVQGYRRRSRHCLCRTHSQGINASLLMSSPLSPHPQLQSSSCVSSKCKEFSYKCLSASWFFCQKNLFYIKFILNVLLFCNFTITTLQLLCLLKIS